MDVLKSKLESMTDAEIKTLKGSVKPPKDCMPGDPDLAVWHACRAELLARDDARQPQSQPGVDIMQVIPFLD